MKTMYDIRQLLKRFGIFVYTGSKLADTEMMEDEIKELYRLQMISLENYQQAILLLHLEKRKFV